MTDFQTKLLKPDGESIDTGGAPSFAFGIETAPEYDRFNPLNLVEGRWPSGSEEVAIDEGSPTTRTSPSATGSASRPSAPPGSSRSSESRGTAI